MQEMATWKSIPDAEEQTPSIEDGGEFEPIAIESSAQPPRSAPKAESSYSFLVRHWPWILPALFVLKILGAALFLLAVVYLAGQDTPKVAAMSSEPVFALPLMNLREQIHATSQHASERGVLKTRRIVTRIVTEGGLKFVLCRPQSETTTIVSPTTTITVTTTPIPQPLPKTQLDMETMEQELIVHKFSTGEDSYFPYTLALNKYNTLHDHALLLPDSFSPQLTPISRVELLLLYWSIRVVGAVGWYNSNRLAGASQKYKHLQLLPTDELWKLRKDDSEYAMLLDELVLPHIESGRWKALPFALYSSTRSHDAVRHLPQFPFRHAVVVLDSETGRRARTVQALDDYAGYLHHVYKLLLKEVRIDESTLEKCSKEEEMSQACEESTAYNFILTEDYMFIAPRSRLAGTVTVNSMGFLGMLLAAQDAQAQRIEAEGGLEELVAVTIPL